MSRWATLVLIVSLLGLAFPSSADDTTQNAGAASGSSPPLSIMEGSALGTLRCQEAIKKRKTPNKETRNCWV